VLRAHTWYSAVQLRSRGASDYALEKRFSEAPRSDGQPWISTGNWRAYRRGRVPERSLVDRVELDFPGTRVWLDLLFWESIRLPAPDFERIYSLLAHVRADIADLLFVRAGFDKARLERRPRTVETFQELDRKSDIESLTACIGLIREAEFLGNKAQHFQGVSTAVRIFLRLAASWPLAETAPAILEYLTGCVFNTTYEHVPRPGPAGSGIPLSVQIRWRNSVVILLEDFEVLTTDHARKRACLYLADVYGLGRAVKELEAINRTADWRVVKSARVVRWFARRLRLFKFTESCLD